MSTTGITGFLKWSNLDEASQDGNDRLSPLEEDILQRYHQTFGEKAFPAPSELRVESRINTGGGRWTNLGHDQPTLLGDGILDLGKYGQIDIAALPYGATFHVNVSGGKVVQLNITVNGDYFWPGDESSYEIYDPKTGLKCRSF